MILNSVYGYHTCPLFNFLGEKQLLDMAGLLEQVDKSKPTIDDRRLLGMCILVLLATKVLYTNHL